MKYNVHLVLDAENDLFQIYKYVATYDSVEKAEKLLTNLEEKCNSLKTFPDRGHVLPELERIGLKTYKEIHYKPYRIIYTISTKDVFIHCILDGRRDLMSLLEERLLR